MERKYGGYIEFETMKGTIFHENAVYLNCGRNCLAYLCEARKIKKIYMPYYLCDSVSEVCRKNNVELEYYKINEQFEPCFMKELDYGEYLYIVNYYGQINNDKLEEIRMKHKHIIVDQAQSYFQAPLKGVDTLYTCRKFFGVSDGAFLYTNTRLERELNMDESFERMRFLMGSYERSAEEFYSGYMENNKLFGKEPVKSMSKLTQNLLRGIDYDTVGKQRQANFRCLDKYLGKFNKLLLNVPYGAYMYPLWVSGGQEVRKKLHELRIYIPMLWPNVLELCDKETLEYKYAVNILPIPVDQRYDEKDMKKMAEEIQKCII